MDDLVLGDLTKPLKLLRDVSSVVDGMKYTFTHSWMYRRLICAHVVHSVMTVGIPAGFVSVPNPIEADPSALWWDEDNQEVRELKALPLNDRPDLDDLSLDRLDKTLDYSSRWWKDNKEDDSIVHDIHNDLDEVWMRDHKLLKRLKKYGKVGILVRPGWEEEAASADIWEQGDVDSHKLGSYFNIAPLLLILHKLYESEWGMLSSAYHCTKDAPLVRRNADGEIPVRDHLFRFKFRVETPNVTFPLYYTQAGTTQP